MEETAASLDRAIVSNRQFQAKILHKIKRLEREKAENRRLSSRVAAQLALTWEKLEDSSLEPARPTKQSRQMQNQSSSRGRKNHLKKKWRYDPYRKWTRRFFLDPDGSIPSHNPDTNRRRILEQGKVFIGQSPPWSKEELQRLRCTVSQVGPGLNPAESVQEVDFEHVAELLNESNQDGSCNRTGSECRVKFLQSTSNSPLTSQESNLVSDNVQKQEKANNVVSWVGVASSLEKSRTTWQCFSNYQSKCSRTSQWSSAEDELLFKYASAMGPSWVFNLQAAAQMSLGILSDKSPKQILARAHASLVNPNYIHDVWSIDEERKLVLCMKVYRDEPSSLNKAAVHFPNRASKSVSEKWNRGLDPDLSSKPFSAEEDEKLLLSVRNSRSLDWSQMSRGFPGRHPRTLSNRWAELASHRDFVEVCAQQGIVKSSAGGASMPSPCDIVVRVKPPGQTESSAQ